MMMIKIAKNFLFSFLFFTLFFPAVAGSDGTVIPTYVGKMPEIPSQRAIIAYRNGKETLIIETSFDGKGEKFGWIIPVPSLPSDVDNISPEFLDHLSQITHPDTIHYPNLTVWAIIILPVITVVIVSLLYKAYGFLKRFIIFGIILIVIGLCAMPNYLSYRGGGGETTLSGIKIINNQIVGNYSISIIEADKAEVLDKWLDGNGFVSLGTKGIEIANEYINKDWYFIAAKLIRKGSELSSTHPILIEFETETPIYPIRLTSINQSDMDIELFLVSNSEGYSTNADMEKIYVSKFKSKELAFSRIRYDTTEKKDIEEKVSSTIFYENRDVYYHKRLLGGKNTEKVLWDGCVITKFYESFKSNEMTDDILFNFYDRRLPVDYFRKLYFTKKTAIVIAASIAYIIGLLIFTHMKRYQKRNRLFSKKRIFLIIVVPIIVFVSIYLSLGEKVSVTKIKCRFLTSDLKNAYTAAQAYFTDNKNSFPSERDLRDWGYTPSGCSMLIFQGDNQSNLGIMALPTKGTGPKAYYVYADGFISWANLDF